MVFVEKSDDVGCGIGIWVWGMIGAVVVQGHGESLAQEWEEGVDWRLGGR
jgi:hypothetical protein